MLVKKSSQRTICSITSNTFGIYWFHLKMFLKSRNTVSKTTISQITSSMLCIGNLRFCRDLIKKYIYIEKCMSTNTLALELVRKNEILTNTAIVTSRQTDGRGQRGSRWEGEHFKNIHLTIILKSPNIKLENIFNINMLTSIACHSMLLCHLDPNLKDKKYLKIKWPNDIYWKDQKLGGILIENVICGGKINYSVIGIGININQKIFNYAFNQQPGEYKVTSLSLINKREFMLEDLISDLINTFSCQYLTGDTEMAIPNMRVLKTPSFIDKNSSETVFEKIKKRYISILYRFDGNRYFFKSGEKKFTGILHDVDYYGRLHIMKEDGTIESYMNKEIQFL